MADRGEVLAGVGQVVALEFGEVAAERAGATAALHGVQAEALAEQAARWLERQAVENLGPQLVLAKRLTNRPGLVLVHQRREGQLTGVSAVTAAGNWFLEATDEDSTRLLIEATRSQVRPVRLSSSGTVKSWARPELARNWSLDREHDLLAMTTNSPVAAAEGRWADAVDVPALVEYQRVYNTERRTSTVPDFRALVASKSVAVLERDGALVSVVVVGGETARFVSVGGTFTYPQYRRRGLARRLMAFVVAATAARNKSVHLIVDSDNEQAIALYRGLQFFEVGSCYIAYLN